MQQLQRRGEQLEAPITPSLSCLCSYLADDDVRGFKMAAEHFGRLSGNGFDLDADLLSFLGAVHGFVVHLDAGDHADVHELKRGGKMSDSNSTQTAAAALRKRLTPLLGTQSGVPCRSTPASMDTPMTMGSLELKMN